MEAKNKNEDQGRGEPTPDDDISELFMFTDG